MLEKMVEMAKAEGKEKNCLIVRLYMQFNYKEYAWSARVFYNDNHIVDIKQTVEGLVIETVQ